MRTTITLEPDVEALLKKLMRERGLSFKDAVNSAIRSALTDREGRAGYSFPTYSLGEPTVDLTHALQIAAALEDGEIVRRMSVGR